MTACSQRSIGRRRRFVAEYLVDGNGTVAAKRTGFAAGTADACECVYIGRKESAWLPLRITVRYTGG